MTPFFFADFHNVVEGGHLGKFKLCEFKTVIWSHERTSQNHFVDYGPCSSHDILAQNSLVQYYHAQWVWIFTQKLDLIFLIFFFLPNPSGNFWDIIIWFYSIYCMFIWGIIREKLYDWEQLKWWIKWFWYIHQLMTLNSTLKPPKNLRDNIYYYSICSCIYFTRPAWCWSAIDKSWRNSTKCDIHINFKLRVRAGCFIAWWRWRTRLPNLLWQQSDCEFLCDILWLWSETTVKASM